MIAETEGADVELVMTGCLLHDIAWFDVLKNNHEHGRIGVNIARPLLEAVGYSPNEIENICYSVASQVDVENPASLEARVVSDADNIDRFGPYRILQWCFSDLSDYENLAKKLTGCVKRLEDYSKNNPLFTSTGKLLFSEQLDLQITFFREFVGEKKLTIMPIL